MKSPSRLTSHIPGGCPPLHPGSWWNLTPILLLVTSILRASLQTIPAADLYVATNGNDSWSGQLQLPNAQQTDGPFASIDRARQQIRTVKQATGLPIGGFTVHVGQGAYRLSKPLQFGNSDSGTQESPIIYRAQPGKQIRLVGGEILSAFKPVTDRSIQTQLSESARSKVLQFDLRAIGVTNYGTAAGGGLELFFQDKPMQLSRWPNEGFVRMVEVLGNTPVDVRGTKGCVEGFFTFQHDRPQRWANETDIWLHGYWFWDWSDQRQKIKSIDVTKKTIELASPYHGYGYRKGQWYYAYNLMAEIDRPGEWYLDRGNGTLYFWPPAAMGDNAVTVSILSNLITFDDVSHVTLRGFILEAARETALVISGGTGNRVLGCTIRNVGSSAVRVSGGSNHGIAGCDVYQCGAGGIALAGGNRKTLKPARHFADNNHVHHYGRWRPMYSAGISLSGVGNRATHNLIENAPHQAISFGGNDHLMEFNEIHSVCYESNDAGAIYAGRNWTTRGTAIRHNYLHDIQGFEDRGCVGVYLDDMYCGTEILGNLFHRVTRAAFIGGGRDCTIENNIFIDCKPALHVDARAMGWAKYHADAWVKEADERGTLSGIRFSEPPYSDRYPKLLNILTEDPWAPKGNVIARNICVGGRWDEIEAKARPMLQFRDNLVDQDPGFVDRSGANFQLRDDSPAYEVGFKRLPIERIGLYAHATRASWPVSHKVR